MAAAERLILLQERNPFASAWAGDPWEGGYPDVPTINEKAFNGICRLLASKANDLSEGMGGIVVGETGEGKTHLIARILKHTKAPSVGAAFAYIQPIVDPERTYRYLLREIVTNLLHPIHPGSELTQLGRLLAELVKDFVKSREPKRPGLIEALTKKPITAFQITLNKRDIAGRAIDYLSGQCPRISRIFLKVLFQYRFPRLKPVVSSWLKGERIDHDDAQLLGVPVDPEASEAALESQALEILCSIGQVLARYKQPMLVCFDRLENLDTPELRRAFSKMIEVLKDRNPAVLPIAFFRAAVWDESFKHGLDQHVRRRIEQNRFELKGCTPEQALQIVRTRLAFVLGVDQLTDLSPFDEADLGQVFGGRAMSPGEVIALANGRLLKLLDQTQPLRPTVDPIDVLQETYEAQYQTILTDFNRYEPDRGRLRAALEDYLRNTPAQGGWAVSALRRGEGRFFGVEAQVAAHDAAFPCTFIIDNERHHLAVLSTLEAGIRLLEGMPSARMCYIRDARCPIPARPRWPTTNARLERIKQRGAIVLWLNDQAAARWYALALLRFAVTAGDVTIVGTDPPARTITQEELARFITERLHGGRYPAFAELDRALSQHAPLAPEPPTRRPPMRPSDEIAHALLAILTATPTMMMHSARLTQALSASLGDLTVEQVLAVVSRYRDRYDTIRSLDGLLVMVRRDWLHAQG